MMNRRLTESRMIRIYLMALASLGVIAILNAGLAWWVTREAVRLASADKTVPDALDSVASAAIAGAAVGGGIATITTALIARYGAREATRNLGSNSSSTQ